jgi:hypothetical protein
MCRNLTFSHKQFLTGNIEIIFTYSVYLFIYNVYVMMLLICTSNISFVVISTCLCMQKTLPIFIAYIIKWHFEPTFQSSDLKLRGYYLFIHKFIGTVYGKIQVCLY